MKQKTKQNNNKLKAMITKPSDIYYYYYYYYYYY